MPQERFLNYVLFDQIASSAFGDRYRAGIIGRKRIVNHVLLQIFNGASLEKEPFWQLIADRRPLAESLEDPHLGRCVAFDRHQEIPFLAYEFHTGRPLNQLLAAARDRRLPIPLDQSLFIVERAALSLTAAYEIHHRGRPVLHGFLVPDLIHLSGDGEIRVIGIEVAPGLRSQLANHPAFAPYLAPEVRAGAPPAETDDVYSLGALLYQILCGQPLPSDPESSSSEVIESALLSPGGEPVPPVIVNLLKNSVAPQANRIPNTATWQQVLSKIILDGEHNPTTFNLSFLMHTVFRDELEAESEAVAREQSQRLSLAPQPDSADVKELEEDSMPAEVGTLTATAVEIRSRRPFLAGFALSFLGAALLIGGYYFFKSRRAEAVEGGIPGAATSAESTLRASGPADPLSLGALPDDAGIVEPVATKDEPSQSPDEEPAPAEASEDEIERLLAEQAESLEASLRAEYEQRLLELQGELDSARTPDALGDLDSEPEIVQDATGAGPPGETPTGTEIAVQNAELDEQIEPSPATGLAPLEQVPTAAQTPEPAGTPVEAESRSEEPIPPAPQSTEIQTQPDPVELPEESADAAQDVAVAVVPPRLESPPRPNYPAAARRLRKSARVTIRVLVGTDGTVAEAELAGPRAGFGFDSAALAAAKRSRWLPASQNGEPIEAWAQLTVDFRP